MCSYQVHRSANREELRRQSDVQPSLPGAPLSRVGPIPRRSGDRPNLQARSRPIRATRTHVPWPDMQDRNQIFPAEAPLQRVSDYGRHWRALHLSPKGRRQHQCHYRNCPLHRERSLRFRGRKRTETPQGDWQRSGKSDEGRREVALRGSGTCAR
jgi:hypothetical protein